MNDATIFGISTAWIISNAWSVLVAIIVLIAGWFIAGLLSRYVTGLLSTRLRHNATIAPLIGQALRYGVLFVTIIIVLGQFGVQTASILAVLGAAGLAVALALQGTLSNIAAGIMLVFLRPFNVGDYIDADGIVGTVVEVGLFATQLRTIDGVYLFAPNSKLSNAKILNYTREQSRVVEVKFNVPRTANLDELRRTLDQQVRGDFSDSSAHPEFWVDTLNDANMVIVARVPVQSRDWWEARSIIQERIRNAVDSANGFAPSA
ncbi:mechanosensitive ion channel family protein [Devosia rhizoryzae]|uniref:Small-conductance mechanosensitive channel n=1 Tax=Devosia rhizoryzae TaxID=2774137 RepID=A0ABX7CBP0_9HYPH|nr:mechanosensitive ion channel family protein [Devosia rhizoryzae]QQR40694.1 mechanosensitive ion channel family protein [Devosia rhizoryzae]